MLPARSRRISGSATLTITASRVTAKNPSSAAASDQPGAMTSGRTRADLLASGAEILAEVLTAPMQPAAPQAREVALSLVMTEPPSSCGADVAWIT